MTKKDILNTLQEKLTLLRMWRDDQDNSDESHVAVLDCIELIRLIRKSSAAQAKHIAASLNIYN